MSLARTLWEANADLAEAALEHRFVRGLAYGSLPLESFRSYVAQDAFFLESFARAYALALARSEDARGMRDFAELISGVIEELELHEGYAERWGVSLEGVEPFEALAAKLEILLDRYAADTPTVRSAYRRAMALEVAFFEANAGETGR
jgi:thiaminase/transcriptional activator TenA